MVNEEIVKAFMDLHHNLLFKKGLFDFYQKMQQEGIEAARRFWDLYPYKNMLFPGVLGIYEKMIDFYLSLGFVPQAKYTAVLREHEGLLAENTFFREIIGQLQLKIFEEGEAKVQGAWKEILDKQIGMKEEIAKNLFEFFGQTRADLQGRGGEKPFKGIERRSQARYQFLSPVEFIVPAVDEETVKGVVLNIGDSGLCLYSSIPLSNGQVIRMKSSLPIKHETFTVRWTNAFMTGLAA